MKEKDMKKLFALLLALVMALSGLFALTLAAVFARAVAFKQENDLTI